jgi:hypothetical protein
MRAFLRGSDTLPRQKLLLLRRLLSGFIATYAIVHLDGHIDNLASMLMSISNRKKKSDILFVRQSGFSEVLVVHTQYQKG